MDRRRSPRVDVEFSVRVWGIDAFFQPFAEPARVKNISSSGVVLKGITHSLRIGSVLEVQLDEGKSQFRVVWIGAAGTHMDGEIGLARLASQPSIWEHPQYLHAVAGHG